MSEKQISYKKSLSFPLLVSCRETFIENATSFYGRFYIGPFEPGQGHTLANALRRVLLSELTGLGLTSVEIEGVSHEYSTLPGVKDSVLDILLNLKQIVFQSNLNFKTPQLAYMQIQGPSKVTASNIQLPYFLRCVNPKQYITTITDNAVLNIKFSIRQGKNYIVSQPFENSSNRPLRSLSNNIFSNFQVNEKFKNKYTLLDKIKKDSFFIKQFNKTIAQNELKNQKIPSGFSKNLKAVQSNFLSEMKKEKMPILPIHLDRENRHFFLFQNKHYLDKILLEKYQFFYAKKNVPSNPIFIDTVFTPVNKVNYYLELDERWNKSPKEIVVLEIWTNGSILPKDALKKAIQHLLHMLVGLKKAKMLST